LSPKGYEHCRKHLLKLPSKATLSRCMSRCGTSNDLCKQRLLAEMSLFKVPVERLCSLINDMSIKEKKFYNKLEDKIYGLDNIKFETIGERPCTANKMLCYVIHGLSTRYTIPAGYFFHSTLTTAQFSTLTLQIFKLLTDCGFIVLRLVTDNHASNVALFKKICSGTLKNHIHQLFLTFSPLFLRFDYCHCMYKKSKILDHDMSSSTGVISSTFLKKMYNLQKGLPAKPVRYLTRKHLYPTNF
jgi:hypothetical protein